jgi:hypothetical protein
VQLTRRPLIDDLEPADLALGMREVSRDS